MYKNQNKIWIITDTHFNHKKLIDIGERPDDFEKRIITKLMANVQDGDRIIHLGDFCIGQDEFWHREFVKATGNARRILIKGNHDGKSDSWYYDHGWDLVTRGMFIKVNGKNVLLTHKPAPKISNTFIGQYNLHGHTHGNVHRDEEHEAFYDPAYHVELALESRKVMYGPVLITSLIN